MNIVSSGGRYMVYGEDVKTYKQIPIGTYDINFNKMTGFFLVKRDDLTINERIYGIVSQKVQKVINTFKVLDRNMGVILSGPKGVGKSMFARELSILGNKEGLPLIICSTPFPDVESFISSINQECIILFDEFEKAFSKTEDYDPQEDLLPLFDGLDGGKKLFVITCNNPDDLNSYLLNRPGRFHYHFCLTAPNEEEIREYLQDNLHINKEENIDKIVSLGGVSNFTYDVLRALCFELNQGYDLKESLEDLNIERNRSLRVIIEVKFENGIVGHSLEPQVIDLTKNDLLNPYLYFDRTKLPDVVKAHLDDVGIRIYTNDIKFGREGCSVDIRKVRPFLSDDYFDIEENDDTTEVRQERQKYAELKNEFTKIKSVNLSVVNDGGFDRKWSV